MSETGAPRAEVLRTRDFVGWAVTGRDGANIGTVSDLLIDRQGRVRYLAVNRGVFRKKAVLLPVEALDWGEGSLSLGWTDPEVTGLPPYDPDVPLSEAVLEELSLAYPRYYRTAGRPPPPIPAEGPNIVPLKEAKDFRLAKGAPNLRGWTVYASDNEKVGVVTEMLVDPAAMKIRYLDVDLADDLFALSDDRHVLIPLEAVDLRERSEDAWITNATSREIARLPAYTGGAVDPLLEEAAVQIFRLQTYPPPAGDETALLPPQGAAPPPPPPSGGFAERGPVPPIGPGARSAEFDERPPPPPPPPAPIVDESAPPPPPPGERPPVWGSAGEGYAPPPPPPPSPGERPPIIVDDRPPPER